MFQRIIKAASLILIIIVLLSGCQSDSRKTNLLDLSLLADGKPHFTERVAYEKWQRGELGEIPKPGNMGFDLRSFDVSAFDLSTAAMEFNDIYFDTWTVWPDKLPEDFNAQTIMELGKDPGLGVRSLHEQGITGKGVNIAIIDQALVQDHIEYADRLMTYETIQCSDESAQMHGSAVTSIAAGKTCGVAPDAKIYYIASTFGIFSPGGGFKEDLRPIAESIERILAINEVLPADEKIKVISISKGITNAPGAQEALTLEKVIDPIKVITQVRFY
jgi:subtilisin family serine protease